MARARVIMYECEECGSEIVVTPTGETVLSPIYCCGVVVAEISSVEKKPSKPAKKIARKTTKKLTQKKVAAKKKPAAKKTTAKK